MEAAGTGLEGDAGESRKGWPESGAGSGAGAGNGSCLGTNRCMSGHHRLLRPIREWDGDGGLINPVDESLRHTQALDDRLERNCAITVFDVHLLVEWERCTLSSIGYAS